MRLLISSVPTAFPSERLFKTDSTSSGVITRLERTEFTLQLILGTSALLSSSRVWSRKKSLSRFALSGKLQWESMGAISIGLYPTGTYILQGNQSVCCGLYLLRELIISIDTLASSRVYSSQRMKIKIYPETSIMWGSTGEDYLTVS